MGLARGGQGKQRKAWGRGRGHLAATPAAHSDQVIEQIVAAPNEKGSHTCPVDGILCLQNCSKLHKSKIGPRGVLQHVGEICVKRGAFCEASSWTEQELVEVATKKRNGAIDIC